MCMTFDLVFQTKGLNSTRADPGVTCSYVYLDLAGNIDIVVAYGNLNRSNFLYFSFWTDFDKILTILLAAFPSQRGGV